MPDFSLSTLKYHAVMPQTTKMPPYLTSSAHGDQHAKLSNHGRIYSLAISFRARVDISHLSTQSISRRR